MTADLLETAFLKGNSFNELTWAIDGKTTYIKSAIIRPTHRFKFVLPGVKEGVGVPMPNNARRRNQKVGMYLGYEVRVLSIENDLIYGDPVPERRIVCHSYGRRADNPWGIGLGSVLYWLAAVFKKEVVKQRLIFLDKYAARLYWFGDPGEAFFNRVWRQIKAVDSADMEERTAAVPEFGAVIHRVVKWGYHEIGLEYIPGETRFRGTKYARKLRSG